MSHDMAFFDVVKARRTIYALDNSSTIPDSRIKEIIETVVLHAPSTFNSQTSRLVVLLKSEHEKLWDLIWDIMRATIPADHLKGTEDKLKGFRGAYGTVLFFEDPQPTKELQTKLPRYADKFPVWAQHTSAIHQYIIWAAFAAEGLGANLQHYNPLIDQKVKETWNIPLEYSLVAQMPFGKPLGPPIEKTFRPLEERLTFHGLDA
ncbi:MAG: hypothetical protein M4579_004516 [Chaenotheca gracillima]|nr:MAG: hypothetical protein M4579_004516 [Chaenotheca gracillima]